MHIEIRPHYLLITGIPQSTIDWFIQISKHKTISCVLFQDENSELNLII